MFKTVISLFFIAIAVTRVSGETGNFLTLKEVKENQETLLTFDSSSSSSSSSSGSGEYFSTSSIISSGCQDSIYGATTIALPLVALAVLN